MFAQYAPGCAPDKNFLWEDALFSPWQRPCPFSNLAGL